METIVQRQGPDWLGTGWPREICCGRWEAENTGWYGDDSLSGGEVRQFSDRVVYTVKDNDCNSGVFIRLPQKSSDPWVAVNTGYEVQIDNGVRHVGGEYHCSGVLYSMTKALSHPQKKPGEWNELEITLDGPRTIVFLNKEKVTDYREGDSVLPKTRWYEPDRGPRPLSGYIGIQNHDSLSTAWFKEIAIKPINKKK